MKKRATWILAYPLIFILGLIFVGPTLPIDISVLLISSIVAAIGLSPSNHSLFEVRPLFAALRSTVFTRIKALASLRLHPRAKGGS